MVFCMGSLLDPVDVVLGKVSLGQFSEVEPTQERVLQGAVVEI